MRSPLQSRPSCPPWLIAALLLVALLAGGALAGSPAAAGEFAGSPGTTEPVGIDTTDPESSAEEAQPAPAWLLWGLGTAVVALSAVAIVRRTRSAEP